jgi:hypothetical protein
MKTLLPDRVYKYPIKGKDYANCISVLELVRSELEANDISNADFVHVDLFMAYIFYEILSKKEEPEGVIKELVKVTGELVRISDHSDAEGALLELAFCSDSKHTCASEIEQSNLGEYLLRKSRI